MPRRNHNANHGHVGYKQHYSALDLGKLRRALDKDRAANAQNSGTAKTERQP